MGEVDSETRERDQWTTKPLACPDGVTRIVTMPLWYWTTLDWLCNNGHFELEHVLPWIMETLHKYPEYEFEEQFQAMLQGCIFECSRRLFPLQNIGHPDNDNGLTAHDPAIG